ncbi:MULTISPECIES: sulfotransferase family protein [Mycolicibacterium]|uniref:Sulfotransferase family protein n=1 Tax=Mycolicibacterium chitae TaxID=1792 RepID=A0A448IDY1_MYCCI|nr:sulfotransferase family protein [Mycolicibacterium chitae]MCV7106035.1 sulfotransferase family protein [Mycolicibacterium chitae]VEG50610.1 Uncharacterised protein [Mycolicibacterium chitae]
MTVPDGQNGTSPRPVIVFVLGVARSGTSALTRVLSLSGAALPDGMLGAGKHNRRGYWEPRASIILNSAFLARQGSSWWDPSLRLLEEGEIEPRDKSAYIAEIVAYLQRLPVAPHTVIKELRITALSEMWFEATRLAGYEPAAVISVRHPQEVIASLGAAGRASPELASALWVKYNLLAERQSRGMPRVFVEYEKLLDDWRREVKRISTTLAMDLDSPDERAIEEFLTPDLRHERHHGAVTDPFGSDWISEIYEVTRAAAGDQLPDTSALDRVYGAYQANEHAFRNAFEGSRRYTDSLLNKISRPSIMKPVFEIQAMARRRKGTWA